MHPVNKWLSVFGLRLSRTTKTIPDKKNNHRAVPSEFQQKYEHYLKECELNNRGFEVFKAFRYDVGDHPISYADFECAFAAYHLAKRKPATILDVGSYRRFVLGLLAHFQVTTVDVRSREAVLDNEIAVNCDAKNLNFPNNAFDSVVSLCVLEHFGLGRYGDEFDLNGDRKAFAEMIRVLRPGGALIFTTTITRALPRIAFNAHRIYGCKMIRSFCDGLELEEERFYSRRIADFCSFEQVTTSPTGWDIYCGCWAKK